MLARDVDVRLNVLLLEKAGALGLKVEQMEVMSDQAYLLAKASAAETLSQ